MNLDTIIKLIDAGYTKEEIAQYELQTQQPTEPVPAPETVPDPQPAPAPEQKPVNEPTAVPTPEAMPVPTPDPAQPTISDLMQQIAKLTSAVQANAIANSFLPGGIPQQPDAASVLGQIIRPTRSKKED